MMCRRQGNSRSQAVSVPIKSAARASFRLLCLILFSLIALPILYLVEPFWRIRIGDLFDSRLGHLTTNTDLFARQLQIDGRPTRTTFVFISWNAANRYLLDMWRRHFVILESVWLKHAIFGILPLLERTRFFQPLPYTGKEHRTFSEVQPIVKFTSEEDEVGRKLLAEMGIGKDDWFVCFHARDVAYLENRVGLGKPPNIVRDVNQENIRNCSIFNYLKSAEWITQKGGFAIRMGEIVEHPLPTSNACIIDYPVQFRSDFLDLYLISKCRFFFGCASGLHGVAYLFNSPFAGANFCPLEEIAVGNRSLYIPKLLHSQDPREPTQFSALKSKGLFNLPPETAHTPKFYADMDLYWVENSPDDILDLCKDMMDRLEGRAPPVGARLIQEAYRKLHDGPNDDDFSSLIGPRFALKYQNLIMARPDGRSAGLADENVDAR
jgi:putative glycosyltransferase (TIGR04372 family)